VGRRAQRSCRVFFVNFFTSTLQREHKSAVTTGSPGSRIPSDFVSHIRSPLITLHFLLSQCPTHDFAGRNGGQRASTFLSFRYSIILAYPMRQRSWAFLGKYSAEVISSYWKKPYVNQGVLVSDQRSTDHRLNSLYQCRIGRW